MFGELFGQDYCGGEPALPAFSTDAHPQKSVGAVSWLSNDLREKAWEEERKKKMDEIQKVGGKIS